MLARGFALIECIIVLTIIAIMTAIGYPGLQHYLQQSHDQALQQTLKQAIYFAAQTANVRALPIGLCRSDHHRCTESGNELMVFMDRHHNGAIDNDAQVLQYFNINLHGGTLAWRAYANHHYLLFATQADNGSFWYCHAKDKKAAWLVTVTQSAEVQIKYPNEVGDLRDSRRREFRC